MKLVSVSDYAEGGEVSVAKNSENIDDMEAFYPKLIKFCRSASLFGPGLFCSVHP